MEYNLVIYAYVYVYTSTVDIDLKCFFVKHPYLTLKIMLLLSFQQKFTWIYSMQWKYVNFEYYF